MENNIAENIKKNIYKLDMGKFRDSIMEWFVTASVANADEKDFKKIVSLKNSDGTYNITMQINGISVDPKKAIKRMEEQFDYQVRKKANEIAQEVIREKCNPFFDSISEVEKLFKKQVAEKFGIKTDEE